MSLIELACRDASCAPPPTGTGGSSPAITTSSGSELYAAVKRLEADGAITPSTQAPLTSGPEDLFRGMSRTDFVDSVLDYGGNVNSIELRPHVTKGVVATQQYLKDRFGEGARVILFRGTDTPEDPFRETMQTLTPYANLRSDALREGLPPSGITSWTAIRSLAEGYGKTVSVAAVPIDRIMSWDWVGAQADPTMLGYEVIVGSTDGVRKAAAGEFPAMERLRPTTTASALIELACREKSCAPPPVGTGGSTSGPEYVVVKPGGGIKLQVAIDSLGALTADETHDALVSVNPRHIAFSMPRASFVHTVLDETEWDSNVPELRPVVTETVQNTQRYLQQRFGTGARVVLMRGTEDTSDPFRELSSDASSITSWTTNRSIAEGYSGSQVGIVVAAVPIDRILAWDSIGMQTDSGLHGDEVLVGTESMVDNILAGEFPAATRTRPATAASALIELACHTAECAPPPTGTGGSSPIDDLADLPEGFVTDAEDAARRVFEFEFTDRGGRKFIAKTDNVEESDAGVVTIEGTIFAPVPIGGGRLRQHAVGYFTRQVDGWRMHHDSLSIMPQHQGKGIGSAFIAESMRRAADEGVTLVSTSALSTKTSNGVYTWLRAGFDTPTGMVTARTTRNKLGARYRTAGDDTLATRLRGRNPVSTADLLASPVAKQALGGMPEGGNAVQMELQMNISDLRTEAALAASIFTDWVERAITFTLAEDETWYEPIHELTAAGCQDASCAPPPVGTGGSKSVSVYHLTDDPKFAPRADFVPEDNTVAIRERTNPGLYVAKGTWDVERWINGSGYLRPYVAEITVPEDAMVDERWGGEGFIPGDKLDQATVKRLVPVDAFAREVYGDYGWVEDTLGTKFDTGEPVPGDRERYSKGGRPTDYVYDGPDVRDMPEAETKRLAKDAEKALGIRTGTTASADPFAGLEVYGFACHDASCAPPPVGTGGSTPGTDGVPGIADQAAYDQYRSTTNNVQLLDVETAAYAQQQVQDAEVVVRIDADRLSDIVNYSEPDDWELRSMHDPENEVGRSLRGEEYLQHRDLYDAAVGLDMGYVVHGYSEAEFSLEPTVVGRTGRTVWVTDDPMHEPLFVHPESAPEERRPLGSVLAMSQGGFTFDPGWVRH